MLRISKLTDYGIVLLAHMARDKGTELWTARDLASKTKIPLPTVGKLLKIFSKGSILQSVRGVHGGYQTSRSPRSITVSEVVSLVEGPIALTECSESNGHCELEIDCPVKDNWMKINSAVHQALVGLTMEDMIGSSHRQIKPKQSNEQVEVAP